MSTHQTGRTRSIVLPALLVLMFAATALFSGGARADEQAAYAPWIGVWETVVAGKDKFTLTIPDSSRGLYGSYTPGNGRVGCRVYDGVLHVKWTQDGNVTGVQRKGRAQLKLSADGKTFSGTSKTDGEDGEVSWSGTRLIYLSGVWSGVLNNNFQLTLTLSQNGETVTGDGEAIFPGPNPTPQRFVILEGKLQDRTLSFILGPTTGGTGALLRNAGIEKLALLENGKTLQGTLSGYPAVVAYAGPVPRSDDGKGRQ